MTGPWIPRRHKVQLWNGASLNEFLERLGFNADPFESTNAEDESQLADYFVPPPYFASVQGDPKNPAPHIVFAPRGSGKTAQRRMIEVESQRAGSYICVTYASFDQPPGFRVEDADLNYHLNQICRLILIGVLFCLEENPDMAEQLTAAQRGVLKFQVERFLGSLSVAEFSNAMRSIKSLGDRAADLWQKYGGPVAVALQLLINKAGLGSATIPTELASEARRDEGLRYHFEQLLEIARALSFDSVYVLVDKVDETAITSANADATFNLIKALLTDLPTIEQNGVGFKFFMWDDIRDDYRERGGRPDRVPASQLRWSVDELASMLARRLSAFSDGRIDSSNAMLCDGAGLDLDCVATKLCQGSPRDMIRILKQILSEATRTTTSIECIPIEAVWQGIRTFANEKALELCPPKFLADLRKVQKLTFTIEHVSSEVFHVSSQSGRSKIQKWESSGVVAKIGEIPNPPNRPMYLFGITDVRVAMAVLPNLEVELILGNYVLECPGCHREVISDQNYCLCRSCEKEFALADAASLLSTCQT